MHVTSIEMAFSRTSITTHVGTAAFPLQLRLNPAVVYGLLPRWYVIWVTASDLRRQSHARPHHEAAEYR